MAVNAKTGPSELTDSELENVRGGANSDDPFADPFADIFSLMSLFRDIIPSSSIQTEAPSAAELKEWQNQAQTATASTPPAFALGMVSASGAIATSHFAGNSGTSDTSGSVKGVGGTSGSGKGT